MLPRDTESTPTWTSALLGVRDQTGWRAESEKLPEGMFAKENDPRDVLADAVKDGLVSDVRVT